MDKQTYENSQNTQTPTQDIAKKLKHRLYIYFSIFICTIIFPLILSIILSGQPGAEFLGIFLLPLWIIGIGFSVTGIFESIRQLKAPTKDKTTIFLASLILVGCSGLWIVLLLVILLND